MNREMVVSVIMDAVMIAVVEEWRNSGSSRYNGCIVISGSFISHDYYS